MTPTQRQGVRLLGSASVVLAGAALGIAQDEEIAWFAASAGLTLLVGSAAGRFITWRPSKDPADYR